MTQEINCVRSVVALVDRCDGCGQIASSDATERVRKPTEAFHAMVDAMPADIPSVLAVPAVEEEDWAIKAMHPELRADYEAAKAEQEADLVHLPSRAADIIDKLIAEGAVKCSTCSRRKKNESPCDALNHGCDGREHWTQDQIIRQGYIEIDVHPETETAVDSLEQIAHQILDLEGKATPGEWHTHEDSDKTIVSDVAPDLSLLGLDTDGTAIVFEQADAELICKYRNGAPALARAYLASLQTEPKRTP